MAQIEHPDNLARFHHPAYRLVTLVLSRLGAGHRRAERVAGLRGPRRRRRPYLRYLNHKMKREALVPIDEQLHTLIGEQQVRVGDAPVLFPRPTRRIPTAGLPLPRRPTGSRSIAGWPVAMFATRRHPVG